MPNYTELKDRILWFDGDSTVSEDDIVNRLVNGKSIDGLFVDSLSDDIQQYNQYAAEQIKVKEHNQFIPNLEWKIPDEYKNLDVIEHIVDLTDQYCVDNKIKSNSIDGELILKRVSKELILYKHYNLFSLLQTLIFVINTLKSNNIVWGIGRGSSVSSFVLFLINVHDVDSIKYELPIEDFLHD